MDDYPYQWISIWDCTFNNKVYGNKLRYKVGKCEKIKQAIPGIAKSLYLLVLETRTNIIIDLFFYLWPKQVSLD
jgi:hypothetical protein